MPIRHWFHTWNTGKAKWGSAHSRPTQTHSPQQHVVQTQRRAHVDPGPRAEPMEATVRLLTFTAQHQFGLQSAVRTSFNLGGSSDPSPAHRGKANLVTPGKVRKGDKSVSIDPKPRQHPSIMAAQRTTAFSPISGLHWHATL